jgi:hypothetical protein
MRLERIFATPIGTPVNDRWAIWTLVHDRSDLKGCNEVAWFVEVWQNDAHIEAELRRIMALPKSYIRQEDLNLRKVKKEAAHLRNLMYPVQLMRSHDQIFFKESAIHIRQFNRLWKPLELVPAQGDLRLKGRVVDLATSNMRLYAICVRPQVYIITGSALKGTPMMQDDPILESQLHRINRVFTLLKDLGLEDDPDRFFQPGPIPLH